MDRMMGPESPEILPHRDLADGVGRTRVLSPKALEGGALGQSRPPCEA